MDTKYGAITEQGDMGLGFNPLNKEDNKVYSEAVEKQQNKDNQQVVNEKK